MCRSLALVVLSLFVSFAQASPVDTGNKLTRHIAATVRRQFKPFTPGLPPVILDNGTLLDTSAPIDGPVAHFTIPSDLSTLGPEPPINATLAAEGYNNITGGTIILPNLNDSALLHDLNSISRRLVRRVEPGEATGGGILTALSNGNYMKVYYGRVVGKVFLNMVMHTIFQQIKLYSATRTTFDSHIDFYATTAEGTKFNYYAHVPRGSSIPISHLEVAFQSLYNTLVAQHDGDETTTVLSWDYLASNANTPLISGFFRQRYNYPEEGGL
ncbi:MAG: hypothetical protein M1828_000147 [Chrysothrix sp. TS-e1954]|nr:MAG: hypothetical protein M1828_000147 [Chrysothrix sp. TS-e1954]